MKLVFSSNPILHQGDSEELLGKWFKRNPTYRDTIFLATKFGFDATDGTIRGDPEFVKASFEESYKKLDVPTVDLYYLHRPAPKTPIEITVGAMAELVKWVPRSRSLPSCSLTSISGTDA